MKQYSSLQLQFGNSYVAPTVKHVIQHNKGASIREAELSIIVLFFVRMK